MNIKTIYTHTDFDGLISGLIMLRVTGLSAKDVRFVSPSDIQRNLIEVEPQSAVTDLPLPRQKGVKIEFWSDHHASTQPDPEYFKESAYDPESPSCARILFDKFKNNPKVAKYEELIKWVDIVDSASYPDLNMVNDMSNPYIRLVKSLKSKDSEFDDTFYLPYLLNKFISMDIEDIADLDIVKLRSDYNIGQSKIYHETVLRHAKYDQGIIYYDITEIKIPGIFGRFDLFIQYPESIAKVMMYRSAKPGFVQISISQNPINRKNKVHIGNLLSKYGGGGHPGVGGAMIKEEDKKKIFKEIIKEMQEGNQ